MPVIVSEWARPAATQFRFLGALIVCLLGGCREEPKLAVEEAAPAALLVQAGGKLQTESVASNAFVVSVTGIDFTDIPIGDADLAPAAKLPYLRTVVLRGTKVTDAGLAVFRDCQYLETVDLSHSAIAGIGLHDLHGSLIKDLNLADSKLGDRGIADLTEIGHHLLRLNLATAQITDEGMERLQGLHALEAIDLSRTRISGAGLRYLPAGLRQLNLSGTSIVNASLMHLERLPLLEFLDLSGTSVTDEAIPHVQAMVEAQNSKASRRKFKYLNLRKTSVSDQAVALLKKSVPGLKVER